MENNNSNQKWYDSKALLIILFFILPPLGIYAMAKHKTDSWKKVIYIIPAVLITLFVGLGTLGAILMDNYKDGLDDYNKQNYVRAYENFERVSQSDENYADAIAKMNEIKPIVDSLKLSAKNEKEATKLAEAEEKRLKNEKRNTEKNKGKDEDTKIVEGIPQLQQDFYVVLGNSIKEYNDAPNELKKSAIRTKRGELIKNVLGSNLSFNGWIGKVKQMSTTGSGKAIFYVQLLKSDAQLKTMNNEFSDYTDQTLIEQTNPLYDVISELQEGDKVKISGKFLPSPENDYVYEISMTESGGMTKPEFIVQFSQVVKQ